MFKPSVLGINVGNMVLTHLGELFYEELKILPKEVL